MSEVVRIPLAGYPGMNRFVLDWVAGRDEAVRFLPRDAPSPERVRRWAPDAELVRALESSNRNWGIDAAPMLRRWESGTSFTIIAGQQVGFAGGPLYTLAKLASVVRLKRDLEREGVEVSAFFWLATEDHDFDEVATCAIPAAEVPEEREINRQLDLVWLRARRTSDPRSVVGSVPVPETLAGALPGLLGIERPHWMREGITFRDSFAELIAELFGNEVMLIDSLLPELRSAGGVLFEQIRSRERDLQRALQVRGAELEEAGYAEQVAARDGEDYTLLFVLDEGGRRTEGNAVAAPPERTSTSAITRPLLQDFVFAPDVFVGGPAEVAYYAQIRPLHELFGITPPRVMLRGHALVAPNRLLRAMARHGIGIETVFQTPDEVVAPHESEAAARIESMRDDLRQELLRRVGEIAAVALPADRSLSASFARSARHIEYHVGKLGDRAMKAVVRKDNERWAAVREIVSTLYPDGKVQDRVVSWLPFWLRSGQTLIDRLVEEIEPDSEHFCIVGL